MSKLNLSFDAVIYLSLHLFMCVCVSLCVCAQQSAVYKVFLQEKSLQRFWLCVGEAYCAYVLKAL